MKMQVSVFVFALLFLSDASAKYVSEDVFPTIGANFSTLIPLDELEFCRNGWVGNASQVPERHAKILTSLPRCPQGTRLMYQVCIYAQKIVSARRTCA